MKLSILIVNWNSKDYLRECLRSIRRTCGGLDPQIVVVDGGSFDGCAEMLAREFPDVDFVQSQENIGFGRANNLGFGEVTGDALLLLNPDTELRPGAVETLLECLRKLPGAGLVGARLLNADGSLQHASVHHLPTPWNVAVDSEWTRRRWWRRRGPKPGTEAREVEAVSGACMMMRAETFRGLGGFDPRYFMYAEDMDLCFRIRESGLRIYHAPRALVLHHGGGSSRTRFSKFSTVMIREAVNVYLRKNHGPLHSAACRALMGCAACCRIAAALAAWPVVSGERRAARKTSMMKWWTVLRWCLGMENWAADKFRAPARAAPLPAAAGGVAQSADV